MVAQWSRPASQSPASVARTRNTLRRSPNAKVPTKHSRERVEEARAVADVMADEKTKKMMLRIADDYQTMAKRAEQLQRDQNSIPGETASAKPPSCHGRHQPRRPANNRPDNPAPAMGPGTVAIPENVGLPKPPPSAKASHCTLVNGDAVVKLVIWPPVACHCGLDSHLFGSGPRCLASTQGAGIGLPGEGCKPEATTDAPAFQIIRDAPARGKNKRPSRQMALNLSSTRGRGGKAQ